MNVHSESNAATEQPAELLRIDSLETLRMLTDPLRMRIMSLFADRHGAPVTVKQVAGQLGVKPTRLYYHVNLLEEHGLLLVASSRVVSGIIEKSYVAAARSITVDPALLTVNPASREATAATVMALMQATASEIADSIAVAVGQSEAQLRQMRIGKSSAHLSPEAHAEFFRRLTELVDEFEEKYGTHGDEPPNRALFVAYYPMAGADGTEQ